MATKREKIVLVETDGASRQALEAKLSIAGYEVFSTESCDEAFEAAGKAGPPPGQQPIPFLSERSLLNKQDM